MGALFVTGHPAMWQQRTVLLKHLPSQWVPGAVASAGLGHPRFVPPRRILGPFFGQGKPQVNRGVAFARDVAQGAGSWTVVDLPQAATPLPGHAHRLATGFWKRRGIEHQHAIALSQLRANVVKQRLSPGGIGPICIKLTSIRLGNAELSEVLLIMRRAFMM